MSNGSFDVNFTTSSSLSSTPFNNVWGDSAEHSLSSQGLFLGSAGTDYTPMGIMQSPSSASAGEGYGLYSYTARYASSTQAGGDYLLLWRADNQWLASSSPNTITEMDMLESWDNSKTEQSTLHYYNSSISGNNGQIFHGTSGLNLAQNHVYSMDWEKGSLTFYIDGKEIYQITGSQVPKDYADGGCNQVMGMGCETETSSVGMYVREAQYTSTADLASSGGAAASMSAQIARENASSTPAVPVTTPVTITVSAPGSVQEASVGAGVTVTETINATGTSTVYAEVLTSSGNVESGFQAVNVSNGTGTISLHLAKAGDYVEVANSASSATVVAKSAAVAISDRIAITTPTPTPTITVSAPGIVQEASVGSGVTLTETIKATNLSTVYAEVLTKSGAVESSYQAVNVNNGTGTVSLHLANSGDTVKVASSLSNPVVTAASSAITITDPTTTSATTSAPSSSLFSISSIAEVKGTLVVVGTRSIGENSTVRDFLDGNYKGVLQDNAKDGTFSYTIAAPTTAGTHMLELTLDSSKLTTSMSFIVGSTGTTGSGTTTGLGTVAGGTSGGSSTVTTPSAPATTSGLTISSLTEDKGQLLMAGEKETGGSNTLREYMDGKYLGTLHDNMKDGAFSMHITDVTSGAHVLKLTLDGSSATATYDFTKEANGSIQSLMPATTSASTLIAATHDTLAHAA